MKVLVVVAHPVPTAFNHRLCAAVVDGLESAGHEVKVADLYREDFQPSMTEADFVQFSGGRMPDDVLAEQARVDWSDAMVFIFPVWWWSVPAILKGWIDRVMSYGYAYVDADDPDAGGMKHRPILVLPTAGATATAFAKRGYDVALHTQLNVGTWDYCGMKDVTTHIFHGLHSETDEALRLQYLDEARALAAAHF